MKKYLIFFYLILVFFTAKSQILTPHWVTMLQDSSLLPEEPQLVKSQPIKLLLDKEQNIYTLNSFPYGWQIQKIESTSGKRIWKNGRNFKSPILDSMQYFPSNFFLNEKNKTLDVLGHQFWVKYPNQLGFLIGNAAKATYNMITGNEMNYTCTDYKKGGVFLLGGGFIERKGGYFILEGSNFGGFYSWLRKTDNNLTNVDTLLSLKVDDEIKNKGMIWKSEPLLMNDKFYQFRSFFSPNKDVLRLDKIDSTGKVIFQKNLIDKFYKFLSVQALSVVDNGFILSAYADTTSTNGTQYLHYLTKLDTNANIIWRSFIFQPDDIPDKYSVLSNNIDGKGWFALSYAYNKQHCNLYWIATNGKSKYIGKIKIPPYENERIFGFNILQLQNKNLVVEFGLTKCTDPNEPPCESDFAGLALFRASDIQKLITSDENLGVGIVTNRVYPNPIHDEINISLKKIDSGKIELYNLSGELVLSKDYKNENEIKWVLSTALPSGIYIVKINSKTDSLFSTKIFIAN